LVSEDVVKEKQRIAEAAKAAINALPSIPKSITDKSNQEKINPPSPHG